jgi:hypothetical protein
MIAPRLYRLGTARFLDTFGPVLQMLRQSWATEFVRITDKARTNGKENLTIRLLNERFQADGTIPAATRQREKALFDALFDEYDRYDVWRFRCEQWFHLDLARNLRPPIGPGANIFAMTSLVLAWYRFVAEYVNGGTEPRYVTHAAPLGKRFVKNFRRMMIAQLRAWRACS